MSYSYNWNREKHITYHVLKPLGIAVVNTIYNLKCYGRENVPDKGSFILACNHVDALDPVLLCVCSRRTCHYMAKSEFFENWVTGSFLSSVNSFPVKRGKADGKSFSYALKVLQSGDVLGIFPEGSRNMTDNKPREAKSGVAHLAAAAHADVLPACLYYERSRLPRPYTAVSFGKMIKYDELGIGEERSPSQLHNAAKKVMDEISSLWMLEDNRRKNRQ